MRKQKLSSSDDCKHLTTNGRSGEKALFCVDCDIKVYDVEGRSCSSCANYIKDPLGLSQSVGSCKKKLMRVTGSLKVTYEIKDGTCFE